MVLETSILIAVIMGLVEVLKRAFKLEKRFLPLAAVLIGVTIVIVEPFVGFGLFQGVIAGLMACGIWSGTKATLGR